MPGIGGLKATKLIKEFPEPPKVFILTLHDNPEYRAEAKLIGDDNFISKSDFGEKLFSAISELFFLKLPLNYYIEILSVQNLNSFDQVEKFKEDVYLFNRRKGYL